MPLAINPVFPVVSAQGVAAGVALQPGTVIDAEVLAQLGVDKVRIALANLTIEALTEVPLQPGDRLQLAVSQTSQGVRLQIVPGEGGVASPGTQASASEAAASARVAPPGAPVQAAASGRVLTDLEALAVSATVQGAAARQGSLSPLFANLGAVASSQTMPQTLQQAAAQLLARRPVLGESLTGDDLKTAFRESGLFFNQALAGGVAPADLKAALTVFRQTVASWLGEASTPEAASPPLSPASEDIALPDIRLAMVAGRAAATGADLTALLQTLPKGVRDAMAELLAAEGRADRAMTDGGHREAASGSAPPPFRGAAPSAQPSLPPSIAPDDPPMAVAHRLIADADAALARQTLLQAASLPDVAGARAEAAMPRWNFEIPFATPQGTAIAQFEISRDGGGATAEPARRAWQARFSLDVEPTGPVHALVSLSGARTSVRMWAERPATAAQLRLNAPQLSHALREAALEPGDIVIGDGAPPRPAPPPAGHFLDRAL
jgi:hypothetical protein